MKTRISDVEVLYNSRYTESFKVELWHDGLKKHRLIRSPERGVTERKAKLQASQWDEEWIRFQGRENSRLGRESKKQDLEAGKRVAADLTGEARRELDQLRSVLSRTLTVNDAIDWETLKDHTVFPERKPQKPKLPIKPTGKVRPPEPKPDDAEFIPKYGLLDKLIPSRRSALHAMLSQKLAAARDEWSNTIQRIEKEDEAVLSAYQTLLVELDRNYQDELRGWEEKRAVFLEDQCGKNEAIEKRRAAYFSKETEAVIEYCDMVLSFSAYPDHFPKEFDLDYNPETKILVVDYSLPPPENIPRVNEVKFVRGELVEQYLSQSQFDKLYDDLLYQTTLRTIHELFEADVVDALLAIAFNGIVTSVDRATGKQVTACVLSIQVRREEFTAINLGSVDPKACFRALKGVGSSKLHSLAAVPPIMQIRRDDGRFVSAYEVANTLDESSNLAAMDWEDFEHLIREVFEKEFKTNGGEVKITQASRDGGVDALAFDPDPIRGGKIVIQAKRYTNTVNAGAVRDLYGTVLNEGANKGILVTTSDYGPDAYSFAKGKPLILLNGANLLHLLERHGHKARIDIQEARSIAMNQAR